MGKIAKTGYHNGCRITSADLVPAKDAGKAPQVAVGFENVAGDYLTYYGSLSDRALSYTVERLRNCGWEGDDLSTIGSIVGNVADIKVVEDEYNGNVSLKVGSIYKPKCRTPTDPATIKSIAAQYMGKIAALGSQQQQEPPPHTDDELIPF